MVVRSSTLRAVGLLLASQALVIGFGCAGKSQRRGADGDGDSGGTAGAASGGESGATPTGGVGPSGGSAIGGGAGTSTGGISGSAAGGVSGNSASGSSGDAGSSSGGVGGAAGAAGDAGAPATNPIECRTKDDCSMASDCCGCRSEPRAGPRFECPLDCARDACRDMAIDTSEVECVSGRCVIARSCDRSRVKCPAKPPLCGEGTVPSVIGDCWGPCLPPTECSWVTDCADCGGAFCFEFAAQLSNYSCLERVEACTDSDNYCGCMGIQCTTCAASDPKATCVCVVC